MLTVDDRAPTPVGGRPAVPKELNALVQVGQIGTVCPHCRWIVATTRLGVLAELSSSLQGTTALLCKSQSGMGVQNKREKDWERVVAFWHLVFTVIVSYPRLKSWLYCINSGWPWGLVLYREASSAGLASIRNVTGWGGCPFQATELHFSLRQTLLRGAASGIK